MVIHVIIIGRDVQVLAASAPGVAVPEWVDSSARFDPNSIGVRFP